jgi:sugar phosphate permease
MAVVYYLLVHDQPPEARATQTRRQSLGDIVGGSWAILRNRRLWPVFAMAFVAYASSFSIAGVWGGVYLNEVHGLGLKERGNVLFLMVGAFARGQFFFGWMGQRIGSLKRSVMIGASLSVVVFMLAAFIPNPSLSVTCAIFLCLGATNGACGTIIPHGRNFYPPDSIGRGVTVLNTLVLLGALTFQIVTGLLVDGLQAMGVALEPTFRILFAAHALALVAGLVLYRGAAEGAQSSAPPAAV